MREIDIYQPATYISQAGRIGGSGTKVYLVHKNNKLYLANVDQTTTYTVFNTGVYFQGDYNQRLDTMAANIRISADSSGVAVYLGSYYTSTGFPSTTSGAKISLFNVSSASNPMSKVDYS